MEIIMWYRLAIVTTAALISAGTCVAAGELPTYEIMGFPVTQHQVMVLGSSHIEERTPTPALTLAGMPASPHQIAVLTPRNTIDEHQIARKLTKAASSQLRLVLPSQYTLTPFHS